MSVTLSEEEAAEVEGVLELLDNLKESVEKYYDWAELLQTEFREMKARVSVLEARVNSMSCETVEGSACGGGGEDDDDDDIVGRLERLRGDSS